MGEQSYFHRKFCVNRFKRSRVAPPSRISASSKLSNGSQQQFDQFMAQQPSPDAGRGKDECRRTDMNTEPVEKEEEEEVQIRSEHETEENRALEIRHIDRSCQLQNSNLSQDCNEGPTPGPSSEYGEIQAEEEPANNEAAHNLPDRTTSCNSISSDQLVRSVTPPTDHIETLNFHPDDTQSIETSELSEIRPAAKGSRLLKVTKSILLFRRATTSLSSVNSNNNNSASLASGPHEHHHRASSSGGYKCSKSFVASFWRQNTADNLTSSRGDSFASFANRDRSHPSLAAFLSGGGAKETSGRNGGAQLNSSSSFGLPRFIVPRMNALKLPIVCLIKSLDDELMREIFIHRYELGQFLIENLKVSLGMNDDKYFGLKMANSLEEQEDVRKPWLELNEPVYKQISKHGQVMTSITNGTTTSVTLYLRIKYYPPNLARVQDQFLKQYLWIQLRRDLRLGKLTSSMNNLTFLMACVLQYELGDYTNELVNNKLPTMSILPNQDLIEQQAIEIWQNRLMGAKRHLVLMQFLRASVILETYGFDYYPVRDHQRQRAYLLGFNYAGVKTIRNGRIVNHFRWHNLSKVSYERRMIIFHIYPNENSKRKEILGFKCLSNDECQNLYLRLLEQKYFFTVDLTYFDKSIRRPSHLNESSATGGGAGQQQTDTGRRAAIDWPVGQKQAAAAAVTTTNADTTAGMGSTKVPPGLQTDRLSDDLEGADSAKNEGEGEDENEEEQELEQESESCVAKPLRRKSAPRRDVQAMANAAATLTTTTASMRTPSLGTGGRLDGETDGLSFRRLNYQHHRTQPGDGSTQASKSTFESSSFEWQTEPALSSSVDHPASSFSQSATNGPANKYGSTTRRRAQAVFVAAKSSSLQEQGQNDPISCQQTDCFSQPSSPSSERFTCCAFTASDNLATTSDPSIVTFPPQMPQYFCCVREPQSDIISQLAQPAVAAATTTRHVQHQHHQQAPLQRQCSFAKYSPVYDNPNATRSLNQHRSWFEKRVPSARTLTDTERAPQGTPQMDGDNRRPPSACQRLVDWTEQFLVQPAALFTGNPMAPGEWPAMDARQATAANQHQDQQPQSSSVRGDIFMQGIKLCLLILFLNFLLRLSDGLSSALIDLLSFGAREPSSSSSSKHSSMFGASSEG